MNKKYLNKLINKLNQRREYLVSKQTTKFNLDSINEILLIDVKLQEYNKQVMN